MLMMEMCFVNVLKFFSIMALIFGCAIPATEVVAQSSYLLSISCFPGDEGTCNLNFVWSCPGGGTPPASSSCEGSSFLEFDTSVALSLTGLSGQISDMTFMLDTSAHLIKKMEFNTSGGCNAISCPNDGLCLASAQYEFDSIPYSGNLRDSIQVTDTFGGTFYKGYFHEYVSLGYVYGRDTECYASDTCGSSITEFIEFSLKPYSQSFVISKPTSISNVFSVSSDPSFIIARFATLSQNELLIIYNALGSQVYLTPVATGTNSMEISRSSLTPGIYFARLGKEIAKFAVIE
jgi:hypothetical protein